MNTVLLGGNGYIGRAVTEYWLEKDKDMIFYVLSRSGRNQIQHDRVINIAADVTDENSVISVLPQSIDYIVDFVGGLEGDAEKMNIVPAEIMMTVAEKYDVKAMGYVGGVLGPKAFTETKRTVIDMLKKSPKRLEVVEPTLVYGNGRKDKMTRMVPLLKFLGLFSKNMKPVKVTEVAKELVDKMAVNYENK